MNCSVENFEATPDRHLGFGNGMLWGDGYEVGTDPASNGWKAMAIVKGSQVLLIGQPDVDVCATLTDHGSYVICRVHIVDPKTTARKFRQGEPLPEGQSLEVTCANNSGIGLRAIQMINAVRDAQHN